MHTRAWLLLAAGVLASGVRIHAQTPPRAEITPLVATDTVPAGSIARVALQIRLSKGAHVNSNKPRESNLIPITVSVDAPAGVTTTELVFPQPTDLQSAGSSLPLSVFEEEFVIGVQLRVADDVRPGELKVPVRVRYQACDERMCYIPTRVETTWTLPVVARGARSNPQHQDVFGRIAFGHGEAPGSTVGAATGSSAPGPNPAQGGSTLDDFIVQGTSGGFLSSSAFLQFIHDAETGVTQKGLFDNRGALAILFLVFVGGLALNLTPCVLPMIPINLAIIGAGAQAGSRGRGLLLGATYGAAMAVVYGVLGVFVILTAGTFGTINSSPWFNAGIALLFVVLALAMFDVLVIDFSSLSSKFNIGSTGRGTFLVAFGMGAVAALLAGACVAPVVIQVVLFASNLYAKGTPAALALPFVLGVGMAVPWPIAGAGIAALPRPGAWMVRIKQGFGVFILATAVYYGYEAYGLFADRLADPAEVSAGVDAQLRSGWHASLDEGLAQAARDGKPVLIDMWATWCKNCGTMDATTLKDPAVTTALANYVKIKFQAESPDESPAKDVMRRFNAVGLPTYVILRHR